MELRPYRSVAPYYDRIYSFKDYRRESQIIRRIARRFGRPGARTLVDVACGTGEHLRYLRKYYVVRGVDRSPEMIRIARRKLPGVPLLRGEMERFHLRRPADLLTCLFSAIGYLPTEAALLRAFLRFHDALRPGGLALIEPWLTPAVFRPGRTSLIEYRSRDLKIARLNGSSLRGSHSVMDMHYLIAARSQVRHLVERHRSRLTPIPRLLALLRRAGFRARFDARAMPMGRGLLIARRPDPDPEPGVRPSSKRSGASRGTRRRARAF
jgi:SAM-dependent methyltransferase